MQIRFVYWNVPLLALLVAATSANAQSTAPDSKPGASASPAPAAYASALRDYRPWREPEPLSWRAANDSAAALGGHLGHLRGNVERIQAMPAAPSPPMPNPGPTK